MAPWGKLWLVLACSTALSIPIVACRTATEMTVDIHTNVACMDSTQWQGVAVYTGSPGLDVETKDPALTTKACDATGHVGSVVVVPESSKDASVGIRIVAGLDKKPEDCAAAGYAGCIVARRTVSFLPHEGIALRIDLTTDCTGLGCDALHTCVDGTCTDARQDIPTVVSDAAAASAATVRCGNAGDTCPVNDLTNACCLALDLSNSDANRCGLQAVDRMRRLLCRTTVRQVLRLRG